MAGSRVARAVPLAPGDLLFGGAVAWIVVGYRVLHQMAAPPAEERVSLRLETEPGR